MDSFLSTTIKTALFVVAFVGMVSSTMGLSTGEKTCNIATHYQIFNDTVNNVGCYPCPDCRPGFEPPIPCGKSVHDSASISEHCIKCKSGTYSTKDDKLPCKKCYNLTCAQHEIVYCDADTGGNSHCTGNCEQGYVWGEKKTECEPQVSTTKKPGDPQTRNTTKNPDEEHTHNTTEKLLVLETGKDDESGMSIDIGILIAIIALVLVILAIGLCWYWRKMRHERTPVQSVGFENDSKSVSEDGSSGSVRTSSEDLLKDGTLQGATIDVVSETYNPVANDSPLQTNNVNLLGGSDPHSISESVNHGTGSEQNTSIRYDHESSPHELIDFHGEEQSSKDMTSTSGPDVTSSLPNPVQCTSTSSQDNLHSQEQCQRSLALNAHHDSPKPNGSSKKKQKRIQVRDVNSIVYKEIRNKLITDRLQGWKILAGEMGYSECEVKDFELANEFGFDGLIINWSNKEVENDIYKFIAILEKMGMATLVALINEELCKPKYRKNML